jgi:hypothetical protein
MKLQPCLALITIISGVTLAGQSITAKLHGRAGPDLDSCEAGEHTI